MKKVQNVSLGEAQSQLEAATKELKLAQSGLVKASQRHETAVEAYSRARINMSSVFNTVRGATAVAALGS